ncbi:MAG TPA: transcription antitermination factor NusB [Candidatus Blautia intestinigallinarum]|nr:transcription antitermination factor NusB [Candidatus Blautia intestinigallinarum]
MGRSKIREHIFKLLFMSQFNETEEMPQQLAMYFEELEELGESDRNYMEEKYRQIISHLEEIDALLNEISKGWKTSRMARVDLTALRLSVYELKYEPEIPTKVSINEAVELAKKYGGEDSFSFVNGILGKAAKELR